MADAPVIKKNILAYLPDVKIKDVTEYLPQHKDEIQNAVWNIYELHLLNNFVFPLKQQIKLSEHDPIAYISGHMTKLKKDEIISQQIIITPVTDTNHGK